MGADASAGRRGRAVPGRYDWLVGGGVDVGESWEEPAVRELAEELGVRVGVRFAFKVLCRGAISPYWLGVHEAVVAEEVSPDPAEIAWHGWVSEGELWKLTRQLAFVPDGVEALRRFSSPRPPSPPPPCSPRGRS